ncbi:MAG TPA: ATP-binding protein [Bacteroidales bacterium]|jgi:NadR type nicotinamide-nucleotide adenylyltransferase|nr:ATP-binding protein [Bacteroidales bacterium]MDI9574199.1 ATP-binding protein [Bacteroidota bacterium]OQC61719.1 MAG: Trifunctional NAD biosynthesis/regulator protein NadR [Bacteroidetes bacterium ADurb.Bin012]MBP9511358.1 ATP-binding protein [Bacteroidales bacterium]MBP9587881.1 ATP-binding protein [Bacteroidales bacterium]
MIKISITGPESTGKSWLSENLAYVFNTIWVKEYAREYLERLDHPYTIDDVITIARKQRQLEHEIASYKPHLMFCDTDMLVCKIWCEVKFGYCPPQIIELYQEDDYQLYLLMDIDLPWVYDPLREHPHFRQELFKIYLNTLTLDHKPFEVIKGLNGERLINAVNAIMHHFVGIKEMLIPERIQSYE